MPISLFENRMNAFKSYDELPFLHKGLLEKDGNSNRKLSDSPEIIDKDKKFVLVRNNMGDMGEVK